MEASVAEAVKGRRSWETPELKSVGTVGAILKGGGGKLTPSPNDPGEIRKPKGGGG
jgi:hypothetical protein